MIYAGIVIDNNSNATDEIYTYSCSRDDIRPGMRVTVGFGLHNRITHGYVASVSDRPPCGLAPEKIKSIREIGDFSISREAMETALWMHRRYLCRYIEAVNCFLPAGFERSGRAKDPFADLQVEPDEPKLLNEEQQRAMDILTPAVRSGSGDMFLIHGVTGAGKTEVYLRAMAECIESGRQGIVLVPEISLTPQTVSRFMARFGKDKVAVIHSKLTPAQRDAAYEKIRAGSVSLVIGARSAVFAPFNDIGLIILDEEHETSYKSDQSPKYDAREVAVKRAQSSGAVLILGSATPSVSDYYRSSRGIFRLIELKERYNKTPLPKVVIADMGAELRRGGNELFSEELCSGIRECLSREKQVILFLNRRGYSSYVSCRDCGYVVSCPECGISMTYHKDEGACICHYCGRKTALPSRCPSCSGTHMGRSGAGTQQIEEKAAELFPGARIERVDLDSVNKKGSLEAILRRFAAGKTDILIGTQMVAKGLDFANVGLVGVISADVSLNIPDFRSAERSFQLITQAAGRAGRGQEQGTVVIQSFNPSHPAVRAAASQDYQSFYSQEIAVRRAVGYPPFSNIFQLVISDADAVKAEKSAIKAAEALREALGGDIPVLGPAPSVLRKQDGRFRYQILVKAPAVRRKQVSDAINMYKRIFAADKGGASLLTADINPYSFI